MARRIVITALAALLLLLALVGDGSMVAAMRGRGGNRVRGFPNMPLGGDGSVPVNAKWGPGVHQRGAPGMTGDATPPGMGGGPGDMSGGDWTVPPEHLDGGSMNAMREEMEKRRAMDDDHDFGMPRDFRQEDAPIGDMPGEEMEPGARGWVRTGRYRKEGDPEPKRRAGGLDDEFKEFMKDPDFAAIMMDKRFTGSDAKPSAKRRAARKGAMANPEDTPEGTSADGRPIVDVDTSECIRQAMRVCPIRFLHDDFAQFTACIVQNREAMRGSCEGWAELQGDCVEDMLKHCKGLEAPATTQCLMNNKEKLSEVCAKGPMFEAMSEGYQEMEAKLKEGVSEFGAAAAGESAAFDSEHGPDDIPEGMDLPSDAGAGSVDGTAGGTPQDGAPGADEL